MDKRYQVFLSSTYADLKEERDKVMQALMEMDCIPSGMELFPAMDEEQFEFIKRIIDDCDYYLLVIGGRYGSLTPQGISYTEKEYDYAIERGLKVIAFLHAKPDEIPAGKTERDPELMQRLIEFREKVSTGRLVKPWTRADELPGLVALSLQKTIKTYPAIGWVRANKLSSEDSLAELNQLRKENEKLRNKLIEVGPPKEIPNIASLNDKFELKGIYKSFHADKHNKWQCTLTWRDIFASISPHFLDNPYDSQVKHALKEAGFKAAKLEAYSTDIDDDIYQSVKVQFLALNLIKRVFPETMPHERPVHYWTLTDLGKKTMLALRSVKRTIPEESDVSSQTSGPTTHSAIRES